jgi:hypothetical protein
VVSRIFYNSSIKMWRSFLDPLSLLVGISVNDFSINSFVVCPHNILGYCVKFLQIQSDFLPIHCSRTVLFKWKYTVFSVRYVQIMSQHVFLDAFAKLRKVTISFVMPVCPHGTTRLPLDGFWRNFIFETFLKICQKD